MFVYIGELCRYLANQPRGPGGDAAQAAAGLRQRPAARRLGEDDAAASACREILEFYGSTEGNVSMFNFDGKLGAIGRVPDYLRSASSTSAWRSSTSRPRRRCAAPDGRCVEAGVGEAGECLGEIKHDARTAYVGYADKAASEKKVLHDAFRAGDAWFRTGDLLQQGRRGLLLFRRPHRRHLPLEGRERLHQRGGRRAGRRAGRARRPTSTACKVGDLDGRAGMAGLVVGTDFDVEGLRRATSPSGCRPTPSRCSCACCRGIADHRHLQVPQARPGGRRLRPGRGQGPALRPRRQGLPEADPPALRQGDERRGEVVTQYPLVPSNDGTQARALQRRDAARKTTPRAFFSRSLGQRLRRASTLRSVHPPLSQPGSRRSSG